MTSIHITGRKGDLEVHFTHQAKPGSERVQPALYLRNPVQKKAFVVFMDDAHEWDCRSESANLTRAMIKAMDAACHLYGVSMPSRSDVMRVLDAVYEWTQDLVHMAPQRLETPAELEKALERDRVVVKLNGHTLVDAR